MALIRDIEMKITNDYCEYTEMAGSDFRVCDDAKTLWQAFEGELKTKQGECHGIGMLNYGSRLHEFLGENLNEFSHDEVKFVVEEVSKRYIEIRDIEVDFTSIKFKKGTINMQITITSLFGRNLHIFSYDTGCG
jgi:phage baseplate assembly protein W